MPYIALGIPGPLKTFRGAGRFRVSTKAILEGLVTADGDIRFDGAGFLDHEVKDTREVFGPVFVNSSVMVAADDRGLRGAVRRLTCARKPENEQYHELLVAHQYTMCTERYQAEWIREMRSRLTEIVPDWYVEEVRALWATLPHPKRQLRINAMRDVYSDGRIHHSTWMSTVDYKSKTGELLPANKYLRAIGDCTTHGSLLGGFLMDYVKEAFEEGFIFGRAGCEFVKAPDLARLRTTFQRLLDPPTDIYMCFFSDDSCVSVRCRDGLYMCNMDISSADGSNFAPVFNILKAGMQFSEIVTDVVDGVFEQTLLPARVRSPEDPRAKVTLTPIGPVLYSGSVLTTSMNNMANTLICMMMAEKYDPNMCMAEAQAFIERCAELCGYIVVAQHAPIPQKLQFLKHSPMYNTRGELEAVLNLGTWMKSFGTCSGPLPGKRKDGYSRAARAYNSEVVRSRVHAGNHCVADAFRTHIISERSRIDLGWFELNTKGGQLGYVPVEELCARYDTSHEEMEWLCEQIRSATVGIAVQGIAIDRIMYTDYDL